MDYGTFLTCAYGDSKKIVAKVAYVTAERIRTQLAKLARIGKTSQLFA